MTSQYMGDAHPPFAPITDDDHAGYLWIVTILGFTYSSMAALLRGYIKWGLYGADDYCLGIATVVHLGHSITVFYGLLNSLSKTNSSTIESQWPLSGKSFFISQLLSILVLCLVKCSVVALIIRVFAIDKLKSWIVSFGLLVFCVGWGVGSLFGLTVNCNMDTITTKDNINQCPRQYLRWQIITAFDIVTDILICLLPVIFSWSLNMARKRKVYTALAFGFRLPLVAVAALHLIYFKSYPNSEQPQMAVTNIILIQQVMITWSLISSTIPNMKSFVKSFTTGMSFPTDWGRTQPDSTSSSKSYALRSINTMSTISNMDQGASYYRETNLQNGSNISTLILRLDGTEHRATISHPNRSKDTRQERRNIRKDETQVMIITKEIEWTVEHE